MVAPWVIPTAITAGSTLASGLMGNKKTKQGPLVPDEVRAAWQKLFNFGETGQFGDFKAGEEVPLGYGDFDMTDIEKTGMSNLGQLINSGLPEQFAMGDTALRDMLTTDPAAIEAQFNPFKTQVQRQIRDSETDLKRGAAFSGNLYSTDTIKRLGDVQARGNESLMSELARLTDRAADRRLSAIPLAYQAGQAGEDIEQGRLAAAFGYGGLPRQLNDAKIKARDQELLRRRQELQLPIQAVQGIAGIQPTYGVPEIETSPFADLLNLAGQIGGQYLTQNMFMNQWKDMMKPAVMPRQESTVFGGEVPVAPPNYYKTAIGGY